VVGVRSGDCRMPDRHSEIGATDGPPIAEGTGGHGVHGAYNAVWGRVPANDILRDSSDGLTLPAILLLAFPAEALAAADLSINKQGPSRVEPQEKFDYVLTVSNVEGADAATNV
jgi:hypothetical protein